MSVKFHGITDTDIKQHVMVIEDFINNGWEIVSQHVTYLRDADDLPHLSYTTYLKCEMHSESSKFADAIMAMSDDELLARASAAPPHTLLTLGL